MLAVRSCEVEERADSGRHLLATVYSDRGQKTLMSHGIVLTNTKLHLFLHQMHIFGQVGYDLVPVTAKRRKYVSIRSITKIDRQAGWCALRNVTTRLCRCCSAISAITLSLRRTRSINILSLHFSHVWTNCHESTYLCLCSSISLSLEIENTSEDIKFRHNDVIVDNWFSRTNMLYKECYLPLVGHISEKLIPA